MKPHKHAKLIKAWADGHEVQFKTPGEGWVSVGDYPCWMDNQEYRIKPAEKVVRWLWACNYKSTNVFGWHLSGLVMSDEEMEDRRDNGVEYKKLEWSREEFDE